VRVGTWNLERGPRASSNRGKAIETVLTDRADLWLLTEIHESWPQTVVSTTRSGGQGTTRWAAIRTELPIVPLTLADANVSPPHPGQEGLCLARLSLDCRDTLLVACSVLPWRGASRTWRGLPEKSQVKQVAFVLDYHADQIRNTRRDGESLLWGGDFNQELGTPISAGTKAGGKRLAELIEEFELVALTADAKHLNPAWLSIDHLLVSKSAAASAAITHRPQSSSGKHLSDHAAYTAEVNF